MNERLKEIFLKLLIVLEVILLIVLFPGMIFISFAVPNQEIFNFVFYTVMGAILLIGVLFIILWPLFGGIKSRTRQVERLPMLFSDYISLKNFLNNSLNNNGYQNQFDLFYNENDIAISMYVKKHEIKILDCFVLIKVEELSNSSIEIINNHISDLLNEYYDNNIITDTVNMIILIGVDRITPAFNKLMNSNTEQGLKNGRFLAGVSFGGKCIYIADQKDGFAIMRYKRMKKRFLNIVNVCE